VATALQGSVAAVIECPASCRSTDVIFGGLCALLGADGRAMAQRDAAEIVQGGALPLTVLLIDAGTVACTPVPLRLPTLH
jgi:hypothetical protein